MLFIISRQKLIVTLVTLFILIGTCSAHAIMYTPWYDVDKYWFLPSPDLTPDISDSNMCGPATLSNILMYTGWGIDYDGNGVLDPRLDIYQEFLDNFPNNPISPLQVFIYYIGRHYPTLNWMDYVKAETRSNNMFPSLETWLAQGSGIYLYIANEHISHAITCWGYETDASGNYTQIYVTDSDDNLRNLFGVQTYNISLHADDSNWHIDNYAFGLVAILAVQAYYPPIPKPTTMLLLGSGLLGLAGYGRKKFFKK